MFVSLAQILASLSRLGNVHPFLGMSFLAFKKAKLPVGKTADDVVFTQIADGILTKYYKPSTTHQGYYNPFFTSDKSKRWVAPRYASTSLQRITTDTFGRAFIHTKKASKWGWAANYLQVISEVSPQRIPAFDLAVWLFRTESFPSEVKPQDLVSRLIEEFALSRAEVSALLDRSIPATEQDWLTSAPVLEVDLLRALGRPPGSSPEEGANLSLLELHEIGPADHFRYEPAERLNIITGDNSLGKTFILESIWWALTGEWLDFPALPRTNTSKRTPKIVFSVSMGRKSQAATVTSRYDWKRQRWERHATSAVLPGFVVYARHDGSFAVWDPTRLHLLDSSSGKPFVLLNRTQIWYGLPANEKSERPQWLCNGLIRDWVAWQTGGERTAEVYKTFVASLRGLSPSDKEILEPGEPVRLAGDAQDYPTVRMPYGEVPVPHASAGVQRIMALAYVLVWAWREHLQNSAMLRTEPQRRMVLMIDEVEAHLHPRWQRIIVPALMRVVAELAGVVALQVHLATHSPMIMASAETVFDQDSDELHHLRQDGRRVILEELPFVKRGRSDWWLMHEAFGLAQARSLPAEQAIETAKRLQLNSSPTQSAVKAANERLVDALAPDDEFWPRWRAFAEKHGVEK